MLKKNTTSLLKWPACWDGHLFDTISVEQVCYISKSIVRHLNNMFVWYSKCQTCLFDSMTIEQACHQPKSENKFLWCMIFNFFCFSTWFEEKKTPMNQAPISTWDNPYSKKNRGHIKKHITQRASIDLQIPKRSIKPPSHKLLWSRRTPPPHARPSFPLHVPSVSNFHQPNME